MLYGVKGLDILVSYARQYKSKVLVDFMQKGLERDIEAVLCIVITRYLIDAMAAFENSEAPHLCRLEEGIRSEPLYIELPLLRESFLVMTEAQQDELRAGATTVGDIKIREVLQDFARLRVYKDRFAEGLRPLQLPAIEA